MLSVFNRILTYFSINTLTLFLPYWSYSPLGIHSWQYLFNGLYAPLFTIFGHMINISS